MHIRRPPSGDGPRIYRPNESVAGARLEPQSHSVAHEPHTIPVMPRDSLLARVNRRRGQILTVMVSVAAIASFASVVWWAHNQDVRAGGKGLEPLVVQASPEPTRTKPENAGGLVPPNQDKEVYNRIQPGTVPAQPEKLLPGPTTPSLPANGVLPTPAQPKTPDVAASGKSPTPLQTASTLSGTTPPATAALGVTQSTTASPSVADKPADKPESPTGPSIASLIDNMNGPTGGWRVQIASVKSEDVAKSTWARLQNAHGDVLANLRMQPVKVDLGDKGVWYRVQAGPLDEKQAQSICGTLKSRKADCVVVPPAR